MLESQGGPFDRKAWRDCWVETFPEWRDASFGAELADGTRAAVSLLLRGKVAESTPHSYGTIATTRQLGESEIRAFLEAARASCGAAELVSRSVAFRSASACQAGAVVRGWTSVVYIEESDPPARFTPNARRSMRKAADAGAELVETHDPGGFLILYAAASTRHWMRFPDDLIRSLARSGIARFFDVRLENRCVASVMALTSGNRWMDWLAAQDSRGRSIDGNYLAVGGMLAAAQRAAVPAVDLGISLDMPGVAHFKRQFGCVEVPLMEYRMMSPAERTRARTTRVIRRGVSKLRRMAGRGRT
jgi:hypothetical protein